MIFHRDSFFFGKIRIHSSGNYRIVFYGAFDDMILWHGFRFLIDTGDFPWISNWILSHFIRNFSNENQISSKFINCTALYDQSQFSTHGFNIDIDFSGIAIVIEAEVTKKVLIAHAPLFMNSEILAMRQLKTHKIQFNFFLYRFITKITFIGC